MAASGKQVSATMEENMRERLLSGEWPVDTAIASENELARQYGVSRMTARSVITQLVGAGLLYRIPGRGTFVAEEAETITRGNRGFSSIREQLTRQGRNITTQLLHMEKIQASASLAKRLEINAGGQVLSVTRLRRMDEKPISLHTSFFPLQRCPGFDELDFVEKDSCEVIKNNYGINRGTVIETLESSVATFEESGSLGVLPGHPLLLLSYTVFSTEKQPYEYSKVVYRGDLIKISFVYD